VQLSGIKYIFCGVEQSMYMYTVVGGEQGHEEHRTRERKGTRGVRR